MTNFCINFHVILSIALQRIIWKENCEKRLSLYCIAPAEIKRHCFHGCFHDIDSKRKGLYFPWIGISVSRKEMNSCIGTYAFGDGVDFILLKFLNFFVAKIAKLKHNKHYSNACTCITSILFNCLNIHSGAI